MQVTGATDGGDIVALTADGELWRLHTFKDMDVWDQLEQPPGASPDPIPPTSPGGTL
jgi:hypothetical protein